MVVLGIDTSCDETSVAILKDGKILANIVASQVEVHSQLGGVVPNLARDSHLTNLPIVYKEAISKSLLGEESIDYIAVTYGPGLAIALETGIDFAMNLASELGVTVLGINHLEGHLFSSFISRKGIVEPISESPMIGLIVSGSHTDLVLVEGIGRYRLLGETLDDACGESFDKVARMINLGYPGGSIIDTLASEYNIKSDPKPDFILPVPMLRSNDLNFSFSGIKTAVAYKLDKVDSSNPEIQKMVAYKFNKVVVESIVRKLDKAVKSNPVKGIVTGGGVLANSMLRRELKYFAKNNGLSIKIPLKEYTGDNAAMIAGVGYLYTTNNHDSDLKYRISHDNIKKYKENNDFEFRKSIIDRKPNLSF